jgi:hypothetical protein
MHCFRALSPDDVVEWDGAGDSDPFERHNRTACPHCRVDVINSVRDHLYTCPLCPDVLRRRARQARENALMLVKDAKALRDRTDVLIREAEVAAAESREALMMVVPHTAKPLYLHADCFAIWNDERRA